jgi:acyl-CoA thioesterase II
MSLFTLEPSGPAGHFHIQVPPALCVGPPEMLFLFGGVGLGLAAAAVEQASGSPLIWATAQYLEPAEPDALLRIEVKLGKVGRFNTQAQVAGSIGERTIFSALAAVGARSHEHDEQWTLPPKVLEPDQCPDDFYWPFTAYTLRDKIEIRHALPAGGADTNSQGRSLLWIRTRDETPLDPPVLAVLADFLTAGVTETLGRGHIGLSLDNTIRICRPASTGWLLCELQLEGAHAGFAHGEMRMFAQTGELVAVASQSMILRAMFTAPAAEPAAAQ